jgi:hypothetical protein
MTLSKTILELRKRSKEKNLVVKDLKMMVALLNLISEQRGSK